MTRKHWVPRLAYVLLGYFLITSFAVFYVRAQEPEHWTPPVQLSKDIFDTGGRPIDTTNPVLVADDWGNVHTFFSGGDDNDILFYTRWDGSTWSAPIDVIYLPNKYIRRPAAAADAQGWLHLVWISNNRIWYSRGLVSEAASAKAWSTPIQVGEESALEVHMAVAADETIYLVYCTSDETPHVAYISSTDSKNWSEPILISLVTYGCTPRLAIDERGRLHIVFGDQDGFAAGTAIYYSRSDDNGQSWLSPLEIDRKDDRYDERYGPTWISVATVGADEVHVVWDGVPAGQRWHQWSSDGGDTWSVPQQISDFRGLTQPNPMVADSTGTLHLVSASLTFGPVYYTYWRNGRWSPWVHIGERQDWDSEGPTLAIARGNILHAAWWNRSDQTVEVWSSTLKLDTPAIPPKLRPTVQAKSKAQMASSPTTVGSLPPSFPPVGGDEGGGRTVSPPTMIRTNIVTRDAFLDVGEPGQQALWIGLLPLTLLLGLVIWVQWMRLRG